MPPKKDPKKDSKKKDNKKKANEPEEENKPPAIREVEKVFFDLQLADCNNKLARLRTTVADFEVRNEELQKAYDKLDEDRADVIAFLKKTLANKNEENSELKEKVKGLEEIREIEIKQFHETVAELEKNFNFMKDQLTSENKLMAGKLNTLEEFRAIRDDLMRKFELQEREFKEQEMMYKRKIYDAEKKFVIGKDKLKKEMEARLLQLAQDFQDATELRIASSTHRVIRENIAINNELDTILQTQAKLADQNEKFRENERAARVAKELAEEERDKAINKNVVQLKVIDQLTKAFQDMKKDAAQAERKNYDIEKLQSQLSKMNKENDNLSLQVRILEQNLHAKMCAQNKSLVEAEKILKENNKLRSILKEAAVAIQASLKMDKWAEEDPTREVLERPILLSRLLSIITQYRDLQRGESIDTLASLGRVYQEGDLGFIPQIPKKKAVRSTEVTSYKSKEEILVEKSSISSSMSSSIAGSLMTVPSVGIIPATSQDELSVKDSWPSFVVSSRSSSTASEVESRATNESVESLEAPGSSFDVKKMLAYSRAEMTKTLVKELQKSQAQLSQMSSDPARKQSLIERKISISEKRKSVIIGLNMQDEGSDSSSLDGARSARGSRGAALGPRVSFSAKHPDNLALSTSADLDDSTANLGDSAEKNKATDAGSEDTKVKPEDKPEVNDETIAEEKTEKLIDDTEHKTED